MTTWDAVATFCFWAALALLGLYVTAFVLFFLWNLACAPYRIRTDEVTALETENARLRAMLKVEGDKFP